MFILNTRLYLYFLPENIIVSPVLPFLYIYISNPKVSCPWLQPPRIQCGGVREKMCLITLYPTSWSGKEVIARRTRQPDYIAVTLSLSRGILKWGYYVAPGTFACIRIRARMYLAGKRPFVNAEESLGIPVSLRVVEQSLAVS